MTTVAINAEFLFSRIYAALIKFALRQGNAADKLKLLWRESVA